MRPRGTSLGTPHYAWVICGACALMLFVSMGLNSNVFTIYQPYIITLNGFTNTQGSLLITVRCLLSIAGMFTVDKVCRRLTLRGTVGMGILFQVLSRLIFAAAHSFPAYCAASALGGLAYSWAGTVPISLLIGHWFHARRGTAFGIGTTGSGFATVLMPPIITKLVTEHGLAFTFFLEAALTALVAVVVLLLIRDRPEDLGIAPYGEGVGSATVSEAGSSAGLTSIQWAAMLGAIVLLAGPAGPGFSHLTVHYTTAGYAAGTVAWLMTYLGIALIVGKILCGHLTDRLGGWRSNFIIGGALLAALTLCCLAPLRTMAFPFLSMTLFGVGLPMASVSLMVWAQDLGGDAGYDAAVKWFTLAYAIGTFLFSALPGIIADCTGSYVPAYLLFISFAAAALLLVQMLYVRHGLHRGNG